jgi:hypothetical protein
MLAQIANGFRMWMPSMPILMTSAQNATARNPARATFRVMPKMTKHEIKEGRNKNMPSCDSYANSKVCCLILTLDGEEDPSRWENF